jgi:hypothetical protein
MDGGPYSGKSPPCPVAPPVVPAKAGTHAARSHGVGRERRGLLLTMPLGIMVPAFAGTTRGGAYASTVFPLLMTVTPRSFTVASKLTTLPSFHISMVTVSPGNTGDENRTACCLNAAGS